VNGGKHPLRVLISSPYGKDALHVQKILNALGIACVSCASVRQLLDEMATPAGAIITTQEIFYSPEISLLSKTLAQQPKWSAIPVIAFYGASSQSYAVKKGAEAPHPDFPEIVFVQRPISATTLVSSVRNAIRDRERQYRMKELLAVLAMDIAERALNTTQLKEAQHSSRQAELSARNANLAKSDFLANMSHEIRTPLGAIMGYAKLIAKPDIERDELTRFGGVISRNSEQLMRIIDDILDLSKVEAGHMTIESVEFSLAELIHDTALLLKVRAQEKGIIFRVTAVTELPEKLYSDPVRIKQVLLNAAGNAIKFTSAGEVSVELSYAGNALRIEVHDTGRGITEAQAETLFSAFVQADSSTTRKFGGTGLGLVLSRRICEAMGGRFILVKSELDRGSSFLAEIQANYSRSGGLTPKGPVRSPEECTLTQEKKEDHPIRHRVLLVEDSPDNQDLFEIILTRMGASVEIASNGKEGVDLALRGNHTVVLMDIQMPVMCGLEATRILRAQGFTKPVVALTAHAMKDEGNRCMDAGFSAFLTKPLDLPKLHELLASLEKKPELSICH
jgi:YD repeat-containing protein